MWAQNKKELHSTVTNARVNTRCPSHKAYIISAIHTPRLPAGRVLFFITGKYSIL
jgi:hypothetical protein